MRIKKTKEVISGKSVVFHGSDKGDLAEIVPNKCKHDKAYVYVCENIALCVVFAVKRVNEGINFGIGRWGMPFIEELYDGAFEDRFRGKTCYVYKLDKSNFTSATHDPQELVCETKVPVLESVKIEDAAEFLIDESKKKHIRIYFYKNYSKKKKLDAEKKLKKALKQYLDFKVLGDDELKNLSAERRASYNWKKQRHDNAYKYFPEMMKELEETKENNNEKHE